MVKLITWISSKSILQIIFYVFSIKLIWWLLALLLIPLYESYLGNIGGPDAYLSTMSRTKEIISRLLIAPFLETAIFQLLIIYILQRFKKIPISFIIIFSAAVFAAMHHYSIFYVAYTFVSGLIYSIIFVACRQKKNYKIAFLMVALLHSVHNLLDYIFT